jgi:hypothetical protein
MNPTHLTRQELYEELGKAQSRDSNTTNKKLRNRVEQLEKELSEYRPIKRIGPQLESCLSQIALNSEIRANKKLLKENTELIEILCDTLYQACGENGNVIDNRCLSAYEDACQFLNRKGKIKDYNGRTGILVG